MRHLSGAIESKCGRENAAARLQVKRDDDMTKELDRSRTFSYTGRPSSSWLLRRISCNLYLNSRLRVDNPSGNVNIGLLDV